jgi:hypothetical protein
MAENETQPPAKMLKFKGFRLKRPELSILLSLVAIGLSLTSITLQIIEGRKLRSRILELEWADQVKGSYLDTIEPNVGTIQFLRRDYTIELTRVNYTPSGLVLDGYVGNPTQIWISSLTLQFTAYEPLSSQRDKFSSEQSQYFFIFSVETIGSAQAETIDNLSPGGRQPFHVAIPNVRQTKDGVQLTVAFSGERYSYGS